MIKKNLIHTFPVSVIDKRVSVNTSSLHFNSSKIKYHETLLTLVVKLCKILLFVKNKISPT